MRGTCPSLAFIAVLAAAPGAAAAGAVDPQHAASCELGRQILADRRGGPVILRTDPFAMDAQAERAPLGFAARDRPPPSAALAWAWGRSPPSNLLDACPELANDPVSVHIATPQDIADSENLRTTRPVTVSRYSAPVFDADFTEALIGYDYRCPGLCAGAMVIHYRKIGSAWVWQFQWPLWFS